MIGNKVCFFQSLNSTNTFIKTHLDEVKNGDIVCARVQTEGKGRRDNIWISVDGNLHFSFLVENKKKEIQPFDVILRVTSTLIHMFDGYGIQATLKYPNDILIRNKKIGGILIEHVLQENDKYIVGVGINVVNDSFDLVHFSATSILSETGKEVDYRDVLFEFIKAYNNLEQSTIQELLTIYLKRSIVLGRTIVIDEKEYVVKTVNKNGDLVLNDEGKEVIKGMNEVTFTGFFHKQ